VLQGKCELVVHDDRALLALQGPSAVKVFAESSVALVPSQCFILLINTGCSVPQRGSMLTLLQVLQPFVDMDLSSVYFSDFHKLDINGIPCYLTRTGYIAAL
jgi:hypothetical protein